MNKNYVEKARETLATRINVEPDLLDLYTLVVLIKGKYATFDDIHDAWSVWKNKTMPDHKSLIPFSELSPEVQEMDREYTEAVQETASVIF